MSGAPRLVVVGGSDAGISAGLRARELDPEVRPTLVIADAYPNFSICGIPYWLSGEVADRRHLAHRSREELERAGLNLRLETVAQQIDVEKRKLIIRTPDDDPEAIEYDRLVIATGAVPARPPIPGIKHAGMHLLHSMDDASAVQDALSAGARSAVIVGAGYIGVEMADALIRRGLDVALIEQAPSALTTVDPEFGALVVEELTAHGVRCTIGVRVLFVCLHNAGRSQMSQALFERAANGRHEARSAGTTPSERVHPEVLAVMRELDLDLSDRTPQLLTRELAEWADTVVTMGCGDQCPYVPGKRYIDWELPDPAGRPIDEVRGTRDEIDLRVRELIGELDTIATITTKERE